MLPASMGSVGAFSVSVRSGVFTAGGTMQACQGDLELTGKRLSQVGFLSGKVRLVPKPGASEERDWTV